MRESPSEPFEPPRARAGRGRRRLPTDRLTPTLLSFGAVLATAIALVVYFALH